MFLTEEEILSQPDCWQRAVDMAEGVRTVWPEQGMRCLLYTSPSPRDS